VRLDTIGFLASSFLYVCIALSHILIFYGLLSEINLDDDDDDDDDDKGLLYY